MTEQTDAAIKDHSIRGGESGECDQHYDARMQKIEFTTTSRRWEEEEVVCNCCSNRQQEKIAGEKRKE